MRVRREDKPMPKGGQRNGYEQRQGATEHQVGTLSLLSTGGARGESTAGSPALRYLSKGKRELFRGVAHVFSILIIITVSK